MTRMESQTEKNALSRAERKAIEKAKLIQKETQRKTFKLVDRVLKKSECERTEEDFALLQSHQDTVQELNKRQNRRNVLKRKQEELFDDAEDLRSKVKQLADAMCRAQHAVIYTGAGISTAASIPDYRGPNGVWTQLQKGRTVRASDLSDAEPTLTHMCIRMLHKLKMVQHVVSQNCDGLHLRSSLPRHALSELHGNMFIERREVIRLFDVTERTALHRHGTGRAVYALRAELRDTIVHFGERGILKQPLNWEGAAEAALKADLILCLGSSLKVLKKYACLWCMKKPVAKRPKLYIVNLQWTPKDDLATLKIHGKCDDVMHLLMEELGVEIPTYNRIEDPIFSLATPLKPDEEHSHSRKTLVPPAGLEGSAPNSMGKAEDMVEGGWFGRGYSKAKKKRKAT